MKYIETILAVCTILPAFGYFYDKGIANASEKTTQEININATIDTGDINHLNKTWIGSYKCNQGLTNLDLSLFSISKSVESNTIYNLEARFNFDFNEISGSYLMLGSYNIETQNLTLKPNKWIKQPNGYEMVPLDGTVSSDLKIYTGKINHKNCDLFKLTAK